MVPIRSHRVRNKQGEEHFIDVFENARTTPSRATTQYASTLLKGRNGRRARKLDKGVYEIDGLKGLYRSEDPLAP